METVEKVKYEKVLRKNEKLREELLEVKCLNFEKLLDKIRKEGYIEEVLQLQITLLENEIKQLKKENELLRESLKKQLAKHLYNLINEKEL